MVAESFAPGASVSKVAQRYGVNAICCSPDGAGTREAQRAAAWTLSLAYDSLTDDGIQFVDLPRNGNGWTARQGGAPLRPDLARARHRTSAHQAKLPLDEWSGRANEQDHQGRHGQTLPLRRQDQLHADLRNFVDAYNFARKLKTLNGLTPYEFICKSWTSDPKKIQP
jgi:hypothetical protein